MKFILATVIGLIGVAALHAGCPHYGQVVTNVPSYYYSPPTYEVEFAMAHPVFNKVDVVRLVQKQVFIPTVVTGQKIVRREVVVKEDVIVADQAKKVLKVRSKY